MFCNKHSDTGEFCYFCRCFFWIYLITSCYFLPSPIVQFLVLTVFVLEDGSITVEAGDSAVFLISSDTSVLINKLTNLAIFKRNALAFKLVTQTCALYQTSEPFLCPTSIRPVKCRFSLSGFNCDNSWSLGSTTLPVFQRFLFRMLLIR